MQGSSLENLVRPTWDVSCKCCCRHCIPTFGMSGGAQIEKCTMFLSGRRMAPAKDDTQVHGPCEG